MEITIEIQETPNPNTLKFVLNKTLLRYESASFKNSEDASSNPIARAIFEVAQSIREVFITENYITVTHDGSENCEGLTSIIKSKILENAAAIISEDIPSDISLSDLESNIENSKETVLSEPEPIDKILEPSNTTETPKEENSDQIDNTHDIEQNTCPEMTIEEVPLEIVDPVTSEEEIEKPIEEIINTEFDLQAVDEIVTEEVNTEELSNTDVQTEPSIVEKAEEFLKQESDDENAEADLTSTDNNLLNNEIIESEISKIEEDNINTVIDELIRPALQRDGGDLKIIEFKDNILTISYKGACVTCPHAEEGTLTAMENILKEKFNPNITIKIEKEEVLSQEESFNNNEKTTDQDIASTSNNSNTDDLYNNTEQESLDYPENEPIQDESGKDQIYQETEREFFADSTSEENNNKEETDK